MIPRAKTTRRPGLLAALTALALLASCSGDDGPQAPLLPTLEGDPLAVTDLAVVGGADGAVTLAWTSPQLQEKSGGGIGYDLRHTLLALAGTPPLTWAVAAAPAPDAGPGTPHQHTVTGLQAGQVYIFALRAATDGQTWSPFCPPAVATAAPGWDTTAPDPVPDLRFTSSQPTAITVSWSPVGGDGPFGAAAGYLVRHATEDFDEAGWAAAQPATGEVVAAGERLQTTVEGLTEGVLYHLAVRARDQAGNLSPLAGTLAVTAGQGRTWLVNVDGTGDAPTIEGACDLAQPGDEIVVGPGRYTWTAQGTGGRYGMIFIPRDRTGFTLRSEAGPEATILDAEGQGGVIHLQGYNDILIEGFTITRGNVPGDPENDELYAGGGITSHLASPVIRNCIISWNNATEGGGVWLGSTGSPRLENCVITGNSALRGGGVALVNDALEIVLSGCEITGNFAVQSGGGVLAYNVLATLEDCLVSGNLSEDQGGAVTFSGVHDGCSIVGGTLIGNQGVRGSALHIFGNAVPALRRSIVAFNSGGPAFSAELSGGLIAGCCDVYGHHQGQAWPTAFTDEGGNFTADPLFCDLETATLQDASPCAEGNHPQQVTCGQIGARPVGCGAPRR